ncbi:hypothetical protein Q7C_1361 [Methylophaga frappieri]|uniref:Uncharacterized protein n=1 Tax=Methylophaga frappieri (strain ATCC BAA-2434 / DSM 25690 / JAM7) TaxID=754477 RepID=I1YHW8_METFJ|nr:hypothetical protein Q7C_1361 [Methylophaga frappieri]
MLPKRHVTEKSTIDDGSSSDVEDAQDFNFYKSTKSDN